MQRNRPDSTTGPTAHLRRRPDCSRAEAARRRGVEEHRHRGEVEAGGDVRRVPRQLQIQSARQERARQVPMSQRWDDHEVTNNWWPGEPLTAEHQRKKYVEKNALSLSARAGRAFHEYMPSQAQTAASTARFRNGSSTSSCSTCAATAGRARGNAYGPASHGPVPRGSSANWSILARHLEGHRRRHAARPHRRSTMDNSKWGVEAVAQGDGPPRGRARDRRPALVHQARRVRNTVWLTADVHYTAAHYYDPNKAVFQDLRAFWEFVSCHAGSFGPNQLDNTFGPQLRYIKAPSKEQGAEPAAQRGPAVLRPRGDRRRERKS